MKFTIILYLFLFAGILRTLGNNDIKSGSCSIEIVADNNDILSITAFVPVFFDYEFDRNEIPFVKNGNRYKATIPMDTEKSLIGLSIKKQFEQEELFLGAFQGSEIIIKYSDGNFDSPNPLWIDFCDGKKIVNVIERFETFRGIAPQKVYSDWKKYLKFEMDSLHPKRMVYALNDMNLPDSVVDPLISSLTRRYIVGRILTYRKDAKSFYGLEFDEVPADFYSFLGTKGIFDDITSTLYWGRFDFFHSLLGLNIFGISPIRESDITQWKYEVAGKLYQFTGKLPESVMDIFVATSYISQLENENLPLTRKQKKNIVDYFQESGLKDILFKYDEEINKNKETKKQLFNLAAEHKSINLTEVLKKHTGKPVVVDFWNTWCAPCLSVLRMNMSIDDYELREGIVHIYVCDTSSDEKSWEAHARKVGGIHYRITEDDMERKLGISAFPKLIFLDRSHNIALEFNRAPLLAEYQKALTSLIE